MQRDLEGGMLVWVPKIVTQNSFIVQYISSSLHSDK